jgi:G3E family GTPase
MTSVHPPSCPVVVVGGYLGAGKTTLVNHMLRHAAGRRVAVLVNDFGTVSIDASLIEGQGDDGVLAIAGGCMCCAYGEDLVGTLSTVAARRPAPQAILVECSGVGLPGAVARAAALVPAIRVEGVVVLVDAAEIVRLIDDVYVGDTVRQQLREADLLIVNQSDRVVEEAWPAVDQVLSTWAPRCPRIRCQRAITPPQVLWGGVGVRRGRRPGAAPSTLLTGRRRHLSDAVATADARFRHFETRVERPVDPALWIEDFSARHPGLLRAKGWVPGRDGRQWLVQVMGQRHSVQPDTSNRLGPTGSVVGICAL